TYSKRMQAALGGAPASPDSSPDSSPGAAGTPGVIWHGGQPRAEAMRLAAAGDVGLSWRHPELDSSLELSTKVLEFGQLGLPVILNRTPMHEALLGADYPLFAASIDDVADVAALACDPAVFDLAASRTSAAADGFALDRAAERLRAYLARAVRPAPTSSGAPLRLVIAGHDLKFFNALIDHFRLQPDIEVRVDHWASLGEHDEAASRELAEWADVVFCEWCGPNAVWYSRHKRRSARLLVRLHRFELDSPYPGQVKIGNVDAVICVSDHYARLAREANGWPAAKVVTVPNALDVPQFDRPKLEGARFNLGLTSMVPRRKRLDLALDVLEELRRDDDRYQLFVKSGMPWELWWVWAHEEERAHYFDAFRRVQRS
ncbi:MAG: glycosyltransferase family 1 protein, partial [Trebonia sp.]